MRSLWFSAALVLVATGCATGAPIGGRYLYVERYEPFAPAAASSSISSLVMESIL